jgi:hypothetical protein
VSSRTKYYLLGLLWLLTTEVRAQFLQFSFIVDTEVTAGTLQELNFGSIISNSSVAIDQNDPNSGWFQLAVLNATELQLAFDIPEYMVLVTERNCNDNWCRFPIRLGFAYYVSDTPALSRSRDLQPMSSNFNVINLSNTPFSMIPDNYLFININVHGGIDVGEVAPGLYKAELLLQVDY